MPPLLEEYPEIKLRDKFTAPYFPGFDSYIKFPQHTISFTGTHRSTLKQLYHELYYNHDFDNALKAIEVLCTRGSIELSDLLIFIDIVVKTNKLTHEKKRNLLKSFLIPDCLRKKRVQDKQTESYLIARFVETYFRLGTEVSTLSISSSDLRNNQSDLSLAYIKDAEDLLRSKIADASFVENPLLAGYMAAISCIKIIRHAYNAMAVNTVSLPAGTVMTISTAPSLADIIRNPLLFSISCKIVSEYETKIQSTNIELGGDGSYDMKMLLSDCKSNLKDALSIHSQYYRQQQRYANQAFSQEYPDISMHVDVGKKRKKTQYTNDVRFPSFFSLDMHSLYIALLCGTGATVEAGTCINKMLSECGINIDEEEDGGLQSLYGKLGNKRAGEFELNKCDPQAASERHYLYRLYTRFKCMQQDMGSEKPIQGALIQGKLSSSVLECIRSWVLYHSGADCTESVYCAFILYRLGQITKFDILRKIMDAIEVCPVNQIRLQWSLWRSLASLLGPLNDAEPQSRKNGDGASNNNAYSNAHPENPHSIPDSHIIVGLNTSDRHLVNDAIDPLVQLLAARCLGHVTDSEHCAIGYGMWSKHLLFNPVALGDLIWGLTESEVELFLFQKWKRSHEAASEAVDLKTYIRRNEELSKMVANNDIYDLHVVAQTLKKMGTLVGVGCRDDWCDFKRGEGMSGWTFGESASQCNRVFDVHSANRCATLSSSAAHTGKKKSGWETDSDSSDSESEGESDESISDDEAHELAKLIINPYSWSTVDIVPQLAGDGQSGVPLLDANKPISLAPNLLIVRDAKNKRRKSDGITDQSSVAGEVSGGTSPPKPRSYRLETVLQSELLRVCFHGGLYSPCYLVTTGHLHSISKQPPANIMSIDSTDTKGSNLPCLNFEQAPKDKNNLDKLKHISKQKHYFGSIGKGHGAITRESMNWSMIELEILTFKIIAACHIAKSCHVVEKYKTDNKTSPINHTISYQDSLFVIRGVQLLLQVGTIGLPYVLFLHRFHVDIKRCVRSGNQMYQQGVQCCSDSRLE